jgi:hypothetical protein
MLAEKSLFAVRAITRATHPRASANSQYHDVLVGTPYRRCDLATENSEVINRVQILDPALERSLARRCPQVSLSTAISDNGRHIVI